MSTGWLNESGHGQNPIGNRRFRMVNRSSGDPPGQLRERHEASDFETKTQDKLDAGAAT